jgi:hypothetical protein
MKTVIRLLAAALTAALLAAAPALAAGELFSFDFENGVPEAWSAGRTFDLDQGKTLGLFNSRNPKTPAATTLRLGGLPAGKPVRLTFDLVLIGSWDSEGELADLFSVISSKGTVLLDLTAFPCKIEGDNEEKPIGNTGLCKVPASSRLLGYWVLPQAIEIAPSEIADGRLELTFKGVTSARKVEFWALDNVRVSLP